MALTDKTIVITPRTGVGSPTNADPNIRFDAAVGSPDGAQTITLYARPINSGTLSFEGTAGQLFSITNDLTGTIFSVNDISGVPSIEVNADGTVALAEFSGNVGIGTGSPTQQLHIQGRDVASANAGILVQARGDAFLNLIADTVSDSELENAYVYFSQDATAVTSVIGTTGGVNVDSLNGAFTGGGNNSLGIHHRFATGEVNIGVNGSVGLTVNDSDGIDVPGTITFGSSNSTLLVSGSDVIMNSITGDVILRSGGANLFRGEGGLAASVYYNGSVKLATTNTGATVTGLLAATSLSGTGAAVTNVDALTLNTRTESSAAGNNTIVLRTAAGYIYCNFLNCTSGATASAPSHIMVETGNDSFVRQQTIANFRTNVVTGATIAGDVTGTIGATIVGNDSHTHAFNNLTSKTGGTGNYTTTGDFTADNFEATGLGPNTNPGTDDGYLGGYGFLGNRASPVYFSNVTGPVVLNYGGLHNINSKLATRSTGITLTGGIYFDEQANAGADTAGDGQVWVRTRTPNDLYFTTDNGIDYPVGYATYRRLTETTLDNINVTETIGQQHMNGVMVKSTTTARTLTLEASTGFNFKVGSQLSIYNRAATGNITVTDTASQTLWHLTGSAAADSVGGVVIAPGGYATLIRESASISVIMGAGIT